MRALKLLRLSEDGASLVCEEPSSGELFAVPATPRLRAAQLTDQFRPEPRSELRPAELKETVIEPLLRPRDIQARIRSGATLAQVAEEAACEPSRIERFAFPVMMERSMIADRGRQARPMVDGVALKETVEKLVRRTLVTRGQAASMEWDAYRTEDATWVLVLTWNAGRSQNAARWMYHHSATSGSVTALDDAAVELMDPEPRPLRTVPEVVVEEAPALVNPLATQHFPESHHPQPAPRTAAADLLFDVPGPARSGNKVAAALAHRAVALPAGVGSSHTVSAGSTPAGSDQVHPEERPAQVARTGTEDSGRRGQRAPMPSWEDVLLGTRSPGR